MDDQFHWVAGERSSGQTSRGDDAAGEHRPLEAYTRALESAGLLIEALREAVPDDEAVARDPADRRWQRIPLFLHMRVVKPA